MKISKQLAESAMEQAKGYKLKKGECTEASVGALIHTYAGSMTTWQDIEGVCLYRTPNPAKAVASTTESEQTEVKRMIVMTDLINEECHCFDNLVILN